MKTIKTLLFVFLTFFLVAGSGLVGSSASDSTLLILCYHDIPAKVDSDSYAVDQKSFVEQIEYLRTHGYNFVSLQDIVSASNNGKKLPENAVLLTFDDAYASFYEFVYPLLAVYGYPCVLGVVTSWINNIPPKDIKTSLMNWEQIKQVSQDPLVEIACHTENLHQEVVYNPQGNTSPAASSRIYHADTGSYETGKEYRIRIQRDLAESKKILQEQLGRNTRALVWPYGHYNLISIQEAKQEGFSVMFTVEGGLADISHIDELSRCMIMHNPPIDVFIKDSKQAFQHVQKQRVIQADLDLLYDHDPVQQEKNLDIFIERVYSMQVSAVFLQAFSDPLGTGNIESVYFPNRVLPVRADLFSRVVNQLYIREISVYAWMPMLSIVLPKKESRNLRVMEYKNGEIKPSESWYKRLSPFSRDALEKLAMLYEDMAASAQIAGVVFQDDGYLNDFEDFNPSAVEEYKQSISQDIIPYQELSPEKQKQWSRIKTKKLLQLTDELKQAVLTYRPNASFARTLYAPVLMEPASEAWFAQNYADSLRAYDYVVIMAYPKLEKVKNPEKWLKKLVNEANKYPGGLQKTVFKIQTYDWNKNRWIKSKTLDSWLRVLVARGAQHIAYYPDNYVENEPDEKIVRMMMSIEDYPFNRR